MKRAALALALVLVAGRALAGEDATREASPLTPAEADRGLLERVFRESGVERTVPKPPWSAYAQAVTEAFFRWLRRLLRPLGPRLVRGAKPVAAAVAAVALLFLLALLVRTLLRRLARRGGVEASPVTLESEAGGAKRRADREAWRARLEARLAAGDVAGALEALWWWLAVSLAREEADPAWTSRELLHRTRRPDLDPFARSLDRMIYGWTRPGADEVRAFFARLREALA